MMFPSYRLSTASILLSFLLAGIAFSLPAEITTTSATPAATSGATMSASSSYNVFSAIASASSSNGATGSTDDPTTDSSANEAGASGSDSEGMNLSTGAIIAIATVAGAAVVIGITSAVLFYVAKKRQWEVREKLRRSARRVVAAVTPRRDTFSRNGGNPLSSPKMTRIPSLSSKRGMVRVDPPPGSRTISHLSQPNQSARTKGFPRPSSHSANNSFSKLGDRESHESYMEKGYGTQTTIQSPSSKDQTQNPQNQNTSNKANEGSTMGTPPKSTFDMDSPVEVKKGWGRFLRR